MEFRVLGRLRVTHDGKALPLGGTKQRAVLALLLLRRGEAVSRDELIDGVWGEEPPRSADQTLTAYISRLRSALDDPAEPTRLVREPRGYRVRLGPGELDLEEFERRLACGREALESDDPAHAREHLTACLMLWSEPPLQDLLEVEACRLASAHLAEKQMSALELRTVADLRLGSAADDVPDLLALLDREVYRESSWALLMRALYQSGRQQEALEAYARARTKLGVEPAPELRHVQQQILRHDPALDAMLPRGQGTVAARSSSRRHRALVLSTVAVVVMAAAVATGLLREPTTTSATVQATTPPTPLASLSPGISIIDVQESKPTAFIPRSQVNGAAFPVYVDGHFWVAEFAPNAFVGIDAATGKVFKAMNVPQPESSSDVESSTVTPFAVADDSMWATTGDDLVRMSTSLGREVDRIHLDRLGEGRGLAEGVAGAGSVWVGRDVGGGQVLRLNPRTGRIQHVFDHLGPRFNLAFAGGGLWLADPRGVVRIDARTNRPLRVHRLRGACAGGGGGCVLASREAGWVSRAVTGVAYRIDDRAAIERWIRTGFGAGFLAYTQGILWAADRDAGKVTAYDAATGRRTATLRFGHPVDTISAGGGYLLVNTSPGRLVTDIISSLGSNTAVFAAHPGELGDGNEPALNVDLGADQIEYATCAKLLNNPDAPGPPRLRPEIAVGMPTLSADRRTYTFRVRPGFRFSPPSGQRVSARTFKYSIQRALSPRLANNQTGQQPPGPRLIDDIVGESDFRTGRRRSISGIHVAGNRLSITLVAPSETFLSRLSTPYFCPVPIGTPYVPGAPFHHEKTGGGPVASAGPYYVSDLNNGQYVVLQRNPNYAGTRPHHLDAIVIRETIGLTAATKLTREGQLDGITAPQGRPYMPGARAEQRWGAATRRTGQKLIVTQSDGTRIAQLLGPRIGCRVYSAAAKGIDLAAICLRDDAP